MKGIAESMSRMLDTISRLTTERDAAEQRVADLLALCRECLDTYEVQTGERRPWKGNATMDGCIAGAWMTTPQKLKKALASDGATP